MAIENIVTAASLPAVKTPNTLYRLETNKIGEYDVHVTNAAGVARYVGKRANLLGNKKLLA